MKSSVFIALAGCVKIKLYFQLDQLNLHLTFSLRSQLVKSSKFKSSNHITFIHEQQKDLIGDN
uniref:Uncharacterized protein n=1 Tax=Arundo donax TaxID=35708 RepID=A0A0A9CBA4_ARUDO